MIAPIHGANSALTQTFLRDREHLEDGRNWLRITLDYCPIWAVAPQKKCSHFHDANQYRMRDDVKYGEDKVKDAVQKMFHFHC